MYYIRVLYSLYTKAKLSEATETQPTLVPSLEIARIKSAPSLAKGVPRLSRRLNVIEPFLRSHESMT